MIQRPLFKLTVITGLLIWGSISQAMVTSKKSAAGILVVGTQAEVNAILADSNVHPTYTQSDENAMVAVSLTRGKMRIYERGAVDAILKFIGGAVNGGVVLTLQIGSDLWKLLGQAAHTVFHVGDAAIKAAIWVLTHTTALILDGVTFVVQVAENILHIVGGLVSWLFG